MNERGNWRRCWESSRISNTDLAEMAHDSVIEGMAAVLTCCLWFISSSGKSWLQSPVHSTGRIEVKTMGESVRRRWRCDDGSD
jgi:hypothetical protein